MGLFCLRRYDRIFMSQSRHISLAFCPSKLREVTNDLVLFCNRKLQVCCSPPCAGCRPGNAFHCRLHPGKPLCLPGSNHRRDLAHLCLRPAKHCQEVSGKGLFSNGLPVFYRHLWHNARRSRIHGQQSHTRLQNQCVLCCPDARYLDADL